MKKINTRTLVFMGLMSALNIVLTRFLSLPIGDTIRIGFGYVPLILTGIVLGPAPAACVALVGDFVGCVFFSAYSWFPPLTLGPIIIAIWFGIFRKYVLIGKYWMILLVCLSGSLISSVLYTTYCLSILYGDGFWPLLWGRAPVQLLTAIIYSTIIFALTKSPVLKMAKQEISGGKGRLS